MSQWLQGRRLQLCSGAVHVHMHAAGGGRAAGNRCPASQRSRAVARGTLGRRHTCEACGCAVLVVWAAAAAAASAASWWHRDSDDCSAELSLAMRRSACSFTSASCAVTNRV
jgi:hypothetical protein